MARTATKSKFTDAQVTEVLDVMASLNRQIVERLKCPHTDPMDVRATLFCPKCLSYRALHASVEAFGGSTIQQVRFRVLQNALVNALRIFDGEQAAQIRSVTAQARPIMHSWGW